MVTSSETVLIARPPAEVFDFTCHLGHEHRWDIEVESVSGADEERAEVGRRYDATFRPFLTESEGTITPLEIVPGVRMVLQADFAGLSSRITYSYSEEGEGTRFTRDVSVDPAGMLRLISPIVTRRVRRCNRRDVANLKRVMEAV